MARFQWTTEYTVFQGEFDAEHRELFRLGEDVYRATQSADAQAVADATRRLIAEVDAHFQHEERMMRAAHYSGYDWHKRQHDGARRRLQEITASPDDLLDYLAGWLRDHTGVADRMMTASLRNAERADPQ